MIEFDERRRMGEPAGEEPTLSERGWDAYVAYMEWRAKYELVAGLLAARQSFLSSALDLPRLLL